MPATHCLSSRCLEQGIDKRRGGGSRQHDEGTEQREDDDDREQPPFLRHAEKRPHLADHTEARLVCEGFVELIACLGHAVWFVSYHKRMTHWIRFEHDDAIGFGTLSQDTITVHTGDMFQTPVATGDTLGVDDVTVLTPTVPGKLLALWNNSRAMAEKMNQAEPSEPLYIIKANGSYLATGGTIRKPSSYDGKVVFEGELGIVIGKTCRAISESESDAHIFGYTCINDVTAFGIVGRDASFPQWTRSKSFDTFGVFGPVVATDLDPSTLSIRTTLDGQERQRYSVDDLFFKPAKIVSAISQDVTLHAGDVICCGTSVGVGSMKPGCTVEVAIDGIGTLRNRYDT